MFLYGMSENSQSNVAPAVFGSIGSILVGLGKAISNFLSPTFAQTGPATAENLPVFGAIVVGIMGIGWSIYSAGPNRLAQTLAEQVAALQRQRADLLKTVEEQDGAIKASLAERNKLLADIGRLEGLLAKYQAQSVAAIVPPAA